MFLGPKKQMRNKRLLTYSILIAGLLSRPGFGETPELSQNQDITLEVSLTDLKKQQEEKRAEKVKQYLENLVFCIKEEDADTGELPEAGFSIEVNNQNLEKLIAAG
ncbi:MAG: hypothetical protein V1752_00230, partial [Candidatus Firestonebacteria bacterium]